MELARFVTILDIGIYLIARSDDSTPLPKTSVDRCRELDNRFRVPTMAASFSKRDTWTRSLGVSRRPLPAPAWFSGILTHLAVIPPVVKRLIQKQSSPFFPSSSVLMNRDTKKKPQTPTLNRNSS